MTAGRCLLFEGQCRTHKSRYQVPIAELAERWTELPQVSVSCLPISPGRNRTSFSQVSEFDRRRIVTGRDCLRAIGRRVGRNQATMMRICHRWMQEETIDQRCRTHTPCCTTVYDDTRIVHISVMDHAATSRTIAQHIQSITHHSVFARTIRRHLQQSGMSARCTLFRSPLIGNHMRLRRQWSNERQT
ncbi:transposable element Tcb1 transposase [Trichonephila clavipes]|nr:transposable element Tcb1 transposase [Trichonephila clavipes]